MTETLEPGEEWPHHYRGYQLQTNADGDIWWQVYQGTDRLYLEPTPEDILESLHSLKRLGGRIRITDGNDVITKVEDDDEYRTLFVGELSLSGELVPAEEPEFAVQVQPTGLSSGDLWPSVYDGAKYSFVGDRVWWTNPGTRKRHPVETPIDDEVLGTLKQFKPRGGSFLITPWNDVLTLVESPPNPETAKEQLNELPRVIQNIILLRRDRDVEMMPIYVGSVEQTPIEVGEPTSLTDKLTPAERAELNSWAGSVGSVTETNPDDHRISEQDTYDDDPDQW